MHDMDLVAFIEARLAEDQEAAEAIDVPDWRSESSWMSELIDPLPSQRRAYDGQFPLITAEDVEHIARHDPAQVLREVAAKRRLLAFLVNLEDKALDGNWWNLDTDLPFKILAATWSDHVNFRPEWSPHR